MSEEGEETMCDVRCNNYSSEQQLVGTATRRNSCAPEQLLAATAARRNNCPSQQLLEIIPQKAKDRSKLLCSPP